ncbi:YfjI family protein [Aquimarina macrocephali]|uniref:YfjI family protein n=1 Tax=Aquimarina macrocephali TaxID=666563 RepID=UPI000465EB85|nr:YfjI family protein [Aquimarina macrocephali]
MKIKLKRSAMLPSFPYEVFPEKIQNIVLETNKHLSFPIDFISSAILYAISISIGNTHKIQIKKGWLESAVLYIAIVGKAGTNKSHPLSFALNPIHKKNEEYFKEYNKQLKEHIRISSLSKKDREKEGLKVPKHPSLEKLIISDYTPEALAKVLNTNIRGVGVYLDELASWFKNFNRYNNGSEMEFWLSAWSCKPINIDRKTGEPILIPNPFLSVCGTIQNDLLDDLAKDGRMSNGFIERILFVIPENIKKPYWTETEIEDQIFNSWETVINKILNIEIDTNTDDSLNPKIVRLSKGAKKIIFKWQRKNADKCNANENETVSGIYSKMEMYAPRIALILQIMYWACNNDSRDEINKKTMKNALRVVEYFTAHALNVSEKIRTKTPVDKLPLDKKVLYKNLPNEFRTGEGLVISEKHRIPERTFKDFLKKENLFRRIKQGHYKKNYK